MAGKAKELPFELGMTVSEEELVELAPECKDYSDIFYRYPESDKELLDLFLPSKLWRLNNLYAIVNKRGVRTRFKMNRAQLLVHTAKREHPRQIILKSRQQGISTYYLIDTVDDALFSTDISAGLMAQGMEEAKKLLNRVNVALDGFPSAIWDLLKLKKETDNKGEIGFNTGSTIYIATSFRSATLQRLHISEYGKICNENPNRAEETKTGTLQAIHSSNPVAIESTAEGDSNDFATMFWEAWENKDRKRDKDYYPIFLSWLEDPDCVSSTPTEPTKDEEEALAELERNLSNTGVYLTDEQRWWWIGQYGELKDKIYQEYPSTPQEAFKKVRTGSYWAKEYYNTLVANNRHSIPDLYEPNLPVHYVSDIGVDDYCVFLAFQVYKDEIRLIDCIYGSGEGLEYWYNQIRSSIWYGNLESEWFPADISVRELSNNAQPRAAYLRGLGCKPRKIPKAGTKGSVMTSINLVRDNIISKLYIDEKLEYIRGCLKNYSKKWDSTNGKWGEPVHDQWSHGADTLRYLAFIVMYAGIVNIGGTDAGYNNRGFRSDSSIPSGFAV